MPGPLDTSTLAAEPDRPAPPASGPRWLVALAAAVAVVCFAGGPSWLETIVGGALDVYVLGGLFAVAVAVAVRLGSAAHAWIAAGVFVGMALGAREAIGSDGYALAVALLVGAEVWALAWLLTVTGAWALREAADLLRYLVVSVAVTAPAGLLAATAVTRATPADDGVPPLWLLWSVDDLFGVLCLAPAVLAFRPVRRASGGALAEYLVYLTYTVTVSYLMFFRVSPGQPGVLGWPYIATLGAVAAAVRFGVRAVAPLSALMALMALMGTASGEGVFAISALTLEQRLVVAELYAAIACGLMLAIAVLRDARERALARTADSLRFMHEVIDAAQSAVFAKSYEPGDENPGRYVLVNKAWEEANGRSARDVIGRSDRELFDPERHAMYVERDRRVLGSGVAERTDDTITDHRGARVSYRTDKFPLRDAAGRVWGVGGIAVDVTTVLRAQEREAQQTALLHAVFELSPTPAVRMRITGPSSYEVAAVNAAALASVLEERGSSGRGNLLSYVHPDDADVAVRLVENAADQSGASDVLAARREVRLLRTDGEVLWTMMSAARLSHPAGGFDEVIIQFEDVTARRAAEAALTSQALTDQVTGLPNRRALDDRLRAALARLSRRSGVLAVMFCDLDRFKDVNDTLGHQTGDELLVAVAHELGLGLRPMDSLARLGGDEFVVVGEDLAAPSDAIAMAARLQGRLRRAWADGQQFRPTMSVGLAITSDPSTSPEELLRRADLAMYRAKDNGRDRIEVYDSEIDDALKRAVTLQRALRNAIDTDGLELHYQPVVRMRDRQIVGAEALIRMRTIDGTLVPPGEFVGQAEASGLIVPMGSWVVRRALADVTRLDAYGPDLMVAVNVSPTQLRDIGFADFLLRQAELNDVPPSRLRVEVTETALLHDPRRSAAELGQLSSAGVSVALDDFGTGFSSLSWLTDFPVDVVKVDRSFTSDVVHDARKAAVVRAITSASDAMGFSVIAEGIETDEQLECLAELGCALGQGYLFGAPAPLGEEPWARYPDRSSAPAPVG